MILNKSNLKFSTVFVFVFVFVFLYFFNMSLELNMDFYPVGLILLAIFILIVMSVYIFQSSINPITLLLPFYFSIIYHQFILSERQNNLSFEAKISIVFFIVFYIIGALIKFKQKNYRIQVDFYMKSKVLLLDIIFYISLLIFLMESLLNGGLPLLLTLLYKVNIYAEMKHIPILHYFIMLNALFPAMYYFYYKKLLISKRKFQILMVISFFILLNLLSRQIIILGLLSFFFVYIKVNKANVNKMLLLTIPAVAGLFIIIGSIRYMAINDELDELVYMKAYSGVPSELSVNMFDVTFNLYTAMNLSTFDKIIHISDDYMYGLYTLKPLIVLFNIDKAFDFQYPDELNTFSQLGTILGDPYLDFGYIGVIIFAFIYGWFVSSIYRKYIYEESIGNIIAWSIVSYVMLMSVFANYFNVLFIWICLLFAFSMNYRFVKNR